MSATKGIVTSGGDTVTYQRISEVIARALHAHGCSLPCAVLSGPSFAQEVAAGQPTAMTIACAERRWPRACSRNSPARHCGFTRMTMWLAWNLAARSRMSSPSLPALSDGLGLGHNSAAALITRGIAEITRLAVACGGRRETMAGLAGLGDLVLTCTGELSRNRRVGIELGKGRRLGDILDGMGGKVAEGVLTTRAALGLASARGIEMPITAQVDAILHRGKSPREAVAELMRRPGRDEL